MYEAILKHHVLPFIGGKRLEDLKRKDFQKVIDSRTAKGAMPKTVRRTYTAMNAVMRAATEKRLIPENLCLGVKQPPAKAKEREHVLTYDEAARFLSIIKESIPKISAKGKPIGYVSVSQELVAFFYLLVYTGARRGEIGGLYWSDVDFDKKTITISKAVSSARGGQYIKEPKTSSGVRKIAVAEEALEELKLWRDEQTKLREETGTKYIFTQKNGELMSLATPTHKMLEVIKYYNRSCKEDERLPEIHLHDLRHTHASLLLGAGADIATVSHRLGHASTSITLDIYTHALPENDRSAAEIISEKIVLKDKKKKASE